MLLVVPGAGTVRPMPPLFLSPLNSVWLKALKVSARNCSLNRSVKAKVLKRVKSQFWRPGPRSASNPKLP